MPKSLRTSSAFVLCQCQAGMVRLRGKLGRQQRLGLPHRSRNRGTDGRPWVGSQLKELTLCVLEFIRRFSLHTLPSGLVRIRHYGILGNNRRKRDIEAARAIFKRRGASAAERCGQSTSCPLCGKAGIRPVAFTDAAGVLHMIGAGPMPYDSS